MQKFRSDKLVLVGGGGHCKSVLDSALKVGRYTEIVVTDKDTSKEKIGVGCSKIATDEELPQLFSDGYKNAFISVGSIESTTVRRRLANMVSRIGFNLVRIEDPSAEISSLAQVGQGVFVGKKAILNAGVIVGDHAIINSGAIVEHDSIVGAFAHISVGAIICGGCSVGEDVLIGAGTTVIQGVRIGNRSIIGAGSLILGDVPDNTIVRGIWKDIGLRCKES